MEGEPSVIVQWDPEGDHILANILKRALESEQAYVRVGGWHGNAVGDVNIAHSLTINADIRLSEFERSVLTRFMSKVADGG